MTKERMLCSVCDAQLIRNVPADVRRLVIAARRVAFEDHDAAAIGELDAASEAFADRVPWDDEPDTPTPATPPTRAALQSPPANEGLVERANKEAIALIDEINERATSRAFHGINQPLHAKLCTIRATLALAALRAGTGGKR